MKAALGQLMPPVRTYQVQSLPSFWSLHLGWEWPQSSSLATKTAQSVTCWCCREALPERAMTLNQRCWAATWSLQQDRSDIHDILIQAQHLG